MNLEEKETIIRFDMASDVAYIYTCQAAWWSMLQKRGYKPIAIIRSAHGGVISKEFEVPKSLIMLRKKKRVSRKAKTATLNNLHKAMEEKHGPAGLHKSTG